MRKLLLSLLALCFVPALFGADSAYEPDRRLWTLSSNRIKAVFQLTPDGLFLAQSVTDLSSGDQWVSSQAGLPVRFTAGSDVFDGQRPYTLADQYTQTVDPAGVRQYIVLQDFTGVAQITVMFEVHDDQSVLRYSARYRNTGGVPVFVTSANMLAWNFTDLTRRYTALRVNQWSTNTLPEDFEQMQTLLDPDGSPVEVVSGAFQKHCGWLALRDTAGRGLFAGWEFDGRAKATLSQSADNGVVSLSAALLDLNHAVAPMSDFEIPPGFIGLFHGDFDEAGYRTQRFVEGVLAKPAPDTGKFPYVSWDSWGYTDQIDEPTLRRNADVAAQLGVELFVVDLGWARSIGDWFADDNKFPHGLKSVSDYVHSLGMKFGLHFALADADPSSPVLQANPDWTTSDNIDYHGAVSLCLANQPTRDWLVLQGIRMIDDYSVDWILQDGSNMVSTCTKTTHTHDPADSNYANSVEGLNAVVASIQQQRPNVLWENCENGGNMMTFNMVKNYVTSITNDANGSLESRRAVYGATYPFPPRYAERYMPDSDGLNTYATHSYLFGGPWVLMNALADRTPEEITFLSQEIGHFKAARTGIASGKVYHIQPPAEDSTDAIQSYSVDQDSSIAIISRTQSQSASYTFRPRGLNPAQQYTVTFESSPAVYTISGAHLMTYGVRVSLPTEFSSEVVHIDHQ